MATFVFDHKSSRNIKISRGCGKSFLEWIVKHKKVWDPPKTPLLKKKKKKSLGCTNPLFMYTHFWTATLLVEGGG